MTADAQIIAIAEFCEWKGISHHLLCGYSPMRPVPYADRVKACPVDELHTIPHDPLPNYLSDLNAMHEAEIWLSKQENGDGGSRMPWYRHNLRIVCQAAPHPFCDPEHATSSQRAEAFLRTINRWKD